MLFYFLYLVIAGIISVIFKNIGGIVIGLPIIGVVSLFRIKLDSHPRILTVVGVLNHIIYAIIYALIILSITVNFEHMFGGNHWFYLIISSIWALTILAGIKNYVIAVLVTSVGGLIAAWLGFSIFGILGIGAISAIVSLIYNIGRVNPIGRISEQENRA